MRLKKFQKTKFKISSFTPRISTNDNILKKSIFHRKAFINFHKFPYLLNFFREIVIFTRRFFNPWDEEIYFYTWHQPAHSEILYSRSINTFRKFAVIVVCSKTCTGRWNWDWRGMMGHCWHLPPTPPVFTNIEKRKK